MNFKFNFIVTLYSFIFYLFNCLWRIVNFIN